MLLRFLIAAHCFAAVCQAATFVVSERLILLPFAEPNSDANAREIVEQQARRTLGKRGFELVPADSIAAVLREHRIRNTAAPTPAEIKLLCASLGADAVLAGTIHRFTADTSFAEAALCARLVRAADMQVLWNRCATVFGGGERSLISAPVQSLEHLAKSATRKLLASLKAKQKLPSKRVSQLIVKSKGKQSRLGCERVAVIPPVDESEAQYASELIADYLATDLRRRGFNVLDAGQVRQTMLACEDLRYGQSVDIVSRALADSLGADLIITGAISILTDTRSASLAVTPDAAFELRMIDPRQNLVVWAQTLRRSGDDRRGLFELGIVHSPAALARDMVREFVSDLRVVRTRAETPNQPSHE